MNPIIRSFLARHIVVGRLSVIDATGRRHQFGDATGQPVEVRFSSKATELAVALNPELALGEAYMDGSLVLEAGSIYDLLELVLKNTPEPSAASGIARMLDRLNFTFRRLHQNNTLLNSKKNVEHHYDLDGGLYDLFLDEDRQYSCAYYPEWDASLEEAQQAKKRHLAAKLLLKPMHRILDIGSGWGGLGLYLAEFGDADVTGVTLSDEQHGLSNRRARESGLHERVRFLLQDYRGLSGPFDRIVSVGMFEHVGVAHYDEFFAKIRDLLTDEGVAVVHSIGRFDGPSYTSPWIRKHIFPGGYIPALSEVLPAVERQGLKVCDVEILRLHYAATLREWRRRFLSRSQDAANLYDERFVRLWEFYLACSETAFRYQGLMNFQIQLSKDQSVVPFTRDYIGQAEQVLMDRESLAHKKTAAESSVAA